MLADFQAERDERCHRWVKNTAGIGILLLLIFAPVDYARPADVFRIALAGRLAAVLLLIFALLLLATSFGRRHPNAIATLILAAPETLMLVMIPITGWHDSSYFPSLSLLLLVPAALLAWETRWTVLQCVMVTVAYAGLGLLGNDPLPLKFWENVLLLLATSVFAVFVSRMRGRLDLHEYERRWAVAEAYRHKSDFFANLSHEIRTPVHVILGYTDMLLDNEVSAGLDGRSLLQGIRSQGQHLHLLLSDLLDSAKVEAGKMEVQCAGVKLPDLARDVVEGFRPLTDEKNLGLSIDCSPAVSSIISDAGKVRQVLTNLLGNAVKFTDRGEIRVEVRQNRELDAIEVEAMRFLRDAAAAEEAPPRVSPDGVAILVRDTGIGIESSAFDWLATDFQQANGLDAKFGGTGLGLSLSRKLVQLLGGQIAAKSQVGMGTTFYVFLPAAP